MAAFYSKVVDNDGTIPADDALIFQIGLLAEMALDGLPQDLSKPWKSKCKMPIICRLSE